MADWFRKVTVEKIVQLADFRRVLFEATHAMFHPAVYKMRHRFGAQGRIRNFPSSIVSTVVKASLSSSQTTKS